MGNALLKDYYAILDVSPESGLVQIRTSYRKLALRYHPDRSSDPRAAEKFHAITEAYEVLRDPERRRAYDASRRVRSHQKEGTSKTHRSPGSARAGRSALTWVEAFFIQAGGIEAEGPGKGSLRRFSAGDLEDIWRAIVHQLYTSGESRQSIQRFQLLEHYVRRHPELALPEDHQARLSEKRTLLNEFETLRRGTGIPWNAEPYTLEDLLRVRRFGEARSLLIWHAAHDMARQMAQSNLFGPSPGEGAPLRELAMVDRLESLAAGEPAQGTLGHGYAACHSCGGWALIWGVGPPRCAHCGSRRFRMRPRDEQDKLLHHLTGRSLPRFYPQIQRIRAAAIQSTERWLWLPLFFLSLIAMLPLFFFLGTTLLPWFAVVLFATGWFAGAWNSVDVAPADTRLLFPREWEVARTLGIGIQYTCAVALLGMALILLVFSAWAFAGATLLSGTLLFFAQDIRRLANTTP